MLKVCQENKLSIKMLQAEQMQQEKGCGLKQPGAS